MSKIKIKLLKTEKPVKEVYTEAGLRILLKKPSIKTAGFDEFRNWTIINFLLSTGVRLSSLINIKMKDVNLAESEIVLRHTKNRSHQLIPIGSTLNLVLNEYLTYRKPSSDEDYLFPTWHNTMISPDSIRSAIRRYNQRRGVQKTSIHLFRHTFAKLYLLNGGDVLRLQKLLGHRSLDMVKEYVNLYGCDLKRDYDKFNPLSNIYNKKHVKW